MWAFIEHHALRASGHCRISHLGSRGQTSLNQGLEHLRRPDHRHMSRLADPENLLLDLRHSLEPNLHSEIASGHHHCGYWPAHYPKQNPRKSFHGGTVLDFEDDPGSRRSKAIEFLDQFRHIFGPPDKGEGDQIAIFRREFEVLAVFGCQRRNPEFGVGQVNAFLCTKPGRAISDVRDLDLKSRFAAFFTKLVDDAFDLAVIKENALTGLCIAEDFRE